MGRKERYADGSTTVHAQKGKTKSMKAEGIYNDIV
jgi:hypothetical protein